MLSPPAQLEVDKFPHHESLSEADGGQDSYPNREGKNEIQGHARIQSSQLCGDNVW